MSLSAADGRTLGSCMLRGLAVGHGFAVIRPGMSASAGDVVPFVPLPLYPGERP